MSLQRELITSLKTVAHTLHDKGYQIEAVTALRACDELERLYKLAYPPKSYLEKRG